MIVPNFLGGSNVVQSPAADQERTVNFYVGPTQAPGGKSAITLYPMPGVEAVGVVTTDAKWRAHEVYAGREFAVIGGGFYEFNSAGAYVRHGVVAFTNLTPATISYNGEGGGQLLITASEQAYLFTLATNVLTTIAALANKATMGDMLDGYFLALDASTATLYISDLLDGATWDPTQFAQRSIASDPWVSLKVTFREIWLIGTATSEVWANIGAFPFPFAPVPNALIPYGTCAPWSVSDTASTLMWLAQTVSGRGDVVQAEGITPRVVTTYAVHHAIDSYQTVSDAVADTYDLEGHVIYSLTFPTADHTWCFDASPNLTLPLAARWTERVSWFDNGEHAARTLYHAFAFGQHRIGDRDTGTLYQLSVNFTSDVDGLPLRRVRRAPAITNENQRLFFNSFELLLESGLGINVGQGSNPIVMLRASNDGGKTFGAELWRSAGPMGQYSKRVRWLRLGSSRDRVFEVVMTDPIPWRLIGAIITADVEEAAA